MPRTSIYAIPDEPRRCTYGRFCCYRDAAGMCDEPRTNKGNSDASCHTLPNKDLLTMLTDVACKPV